MRVFISACFFFFFSFFFSFFSLFFFFFFFLFVRKANAQDCTAIPRHAVRRCITNNYSPSDRRYYTQNGEKTRRYRNLESATTKKHFPHLQCSQAKYIFRTFNVVRRNTSKIKFGGFRPDDLNDSLSFSTKEQLKALTILPYATLRPRARLSIYSNHPRRLRPNVGVGQDLPERRRPLRSPNLRVLAEDAVDRRRLRPHGQGDPPAARVCQRC